MLRETQCCARPLVLCAAVLVSPFVSPLPARAQDDSLFDRPFARLFTSDVEPVPRWQSSLFPLVPSTPSSTGAAPQLPSFTPRSLFTEARESATRELEAGARPPYALTWLYVTFAALQALDVHSTARAIAAGHGEGNPMMGGIAGNTPALVAVKGATAVAVIAAGHRLSKKRPRAAALLMVALNAVSAAVVVHNYRAVDAR